MKLKKWSFFLAGLMLFALLGQCFPGFEAEAAGPTNPTALDNIPLCGVPAHGAARCNSYKHIKNDVQINATTGIAGYDVLDLQTAYNLVSASANNGTGKTVAIVDAYDDPYAESDLAVYRSKFNLPECTTVNGCFKKVNQLGEQGNYPAPNSGWAGEIA